MAREQDFDSFDGWTARYDERRHTMWFEHPDHRPNRVIGSVDASPQSLYLRGRRDTLEALMQQSGDQKLLARHESELKTFRASGEGDDKAKADATYAEFLATADAKAKSSFEAAERAATLDKVGRAHASGSSFEWCAQRLKDAGFAGREMAEALASLTEESKE